MLCQRSLTGWENKTTQLLPMKSWNLMGPVEVWVSKSGAVEPRRILATVLAAVIVVREQ